MRVHVVSLLRLVRSCHGNRIHSTVRISLLLHVLHVLRYVGAKMGARSELVMHIHGRLSRVREGMSHGTHVEVLRVVERWDVVKLSRRQMIELRLKGSTAFVRLLQQVCIVGAEASLGVRLFAR